VQTPDVRVVGRYALYNAIAAGGMATVHLGRLLGPVGFSRTVAIKRLHAQFASDPEFVSMFLDEARLAARIRHPNVVQTLDVVATDGELFLVMDYVPGESVARLSRALRERQEPLPLRILSTIVSGVLHGLHAAHEAKDERGQPLGIVHRDVSPQNVLVGADGVPRVIDFGVAKAAGRVQTTKEGQIKGKISYMPPEQLRGASVSRQTDIYAVGVMVWELVTGQRLFSGDNEGVVVARILEGRVEPPSHVVTRSRRVPLTDETMRLLEALDSTILRALNMRPEDRFSTAREMALEVERTCQPATNSETSDWVEATAGDVLAARGAMVAEIESAPSPQPSAESPEGHVLAVLGTGSGLHSNARFMEQTAPSAYANTLHAADFGAQYVHLANVDGPPVTQPSSISVTTGARMETVPPEAQRPMTTAIAVGLLLGAAIITGVVVYAKSRNLASQQLPQPSLDPYATLTAPLPPPGVSPPTMPGFEVADADAGGRTVLVAPPGPTPGSAPQATTVTVTTTTTTTAPTPPPVYRPPYSGPRRPPPTSKPANSSGSPSDDCTYFDAAGVKHYKQTPQCLGK
jgi:serine/threonine-protein kinase